MNVAELIDFARRESGTSDENLEYTASVILGLLNQQNKLHIEPLVASTRAGYWYHTFTRTLAAGNPYVRLPARACAFDQCDISTDGGSRWQALAQALEADADKWANEYRGRPYPCAYTVRGTSLFLLPTPSAAVQLRAKVVLRPSVLVDASTAGRITGITGNVLTVNAMPANIVSTTVCDVIQPRDAFELALVDAPMTVTSPTELTVNAAFGLGRVEAGDYVRAAETSDWPQLPQSFHPLLATLAAAVITDQRELDKRTERLAGKAGALMAKLEATLGPRVKSSANRPLAHDWL